MPAAPDDAERFVRCLLGLPDLQLRVDWLNAQVQTEPPYLLAPLLDVVIGESEIGEARAREALLTIALWAAGMASTCDLDRLRQVALEQRLLSLQRVIRRVPTATLPPEGSEPRIPNYGAGRELTLGERRSLARRSGRQRFDALIKDPHPMVIRELLSNPKTTEDDVVRVAAVRPARPTSILAIASTRWLARPRVRMSVLQNPGSPLSVALPLVGLCTRGELLELARGADVPPLLRITAGELAERRAPLSQPAPTRSSRFPESYSAFPDSDNDSDSDSEPDSDEPGPVLQ
jgi:hypothetical protein